MQFFCVKILSYQKKAVPLHRFSAEWDLSTRRERENMTASLAQLARARDL